MNLLRDGIAGGGRIWADLGSGAGAFTLALADLMAHEGTIYSVDRRGDSLREQERAMRAGFPAATVQYLCADFTKPLELPPLDGIVMANSLHFQRDPESVLASVKGYLRPGGRLVVVEYNAERGNTWVPYPISFARWQQLASGAGFATTRLLATRRSSFMNEIYSALSC